MDFDGPSDFNQDENEHVYFQSCTTDLCNIGLTSPVELIIDDDESENVSRNSTEDISGNSTESISGNSTDLGQSCAWKIRIFKLIVIHSTYMVLIPGLQCYFCQGSDYDSCVMGNNDQQLICQEDEECYVLRKHTYLYYYRKPKLKSDYESIYPFRDYKNPENEWKLGSPPREEDEENYELELHVEILVEVWRGCKPTNHSFEYPNNSSIDIFTQSCSINLCNLGMSYGPGEGAYISSANLSGIFHTKKLFHPKLILVSIAGQGHHIIIFIFFLVFTILR